MSKSWCCRCRIPTPDEGEIKYVRTKNDKLRKMCDCKCGTHKSTFINQKTAGALTDDEKQDANYWSRIAASVYETPQDRAKYLHEAGINVDTDDVDDSELQDDTTAVYRDPKTGKYIFAMRGSADKKDLMADARIVQGHLEKSGRYKNWDTKLKQLIDKHGIENIDRAVGHSLAGRAALDLGKKYNLPSESFNTGSAPVDIPSNVYKKMKCKLYPNEADCAMAKKHHQWITHLDPIGLSSAISPYRDRYIYPRTANPHGISNWFY